MTSAGTKAAQALLREIAGVLSVEPKVLRLTRGAIEVAIADVEAAAERRGARAARRRIAQVLAELEAEAKHVTHEGVAYRRARRAIARRSAGPWGSKQVPRC